MCTKLGILHNKDDGDTYIYNDVIYIRFVGLAAALLMLMLMLMLESLRAYTSGLHHKRSICYCFFFFFL